MNTLDYIPRKKILELKLLIFFIFSNCMTGAAILKNKERTINFNPGSYFIVGIRNNKYLQLTQIVQGNFINRCYLIKERIIEKFESEIDLNICEAHFYSLSDSNNIYFPDHSILLENPGKKYFTSYIIKGIDSKEKILKIFFSESANLIVFTNKNKYYCKDIYGCTKIKDEPQESFFEISFKENSPYIVVISGNKFYAKKRNNENGMLKIYIHENIKKEEVSFIKEADYMGLIIVTPFAMAYDAVALPLAAIGVPLWYIGNVALAPVFDKSYKSFPLIIVPILFSPFLISGVILSAPYLYSKKVYDDQKKSE